jgi:hypothetical protein
MTINRTFFKNLMFGLFFIIILFNNIIMQYVPVFTYLDEFIVLLAIFAIIYNLCKNRLEASQITLIVLLLIVIIIGFIGNVITNYQSSMIAILKDIIAFIKLPIVAIATINFKSDEIFSDSIVILSKIFLVILSVFCIVSQFVDLGMTWDLRYGVYSFKFLFTHPTFLVYSVVLMSVVIVANGLIRKRDYIYVLLSMFLLIMSMRDKGFAYAALLFVLVFLLRKNKKVKARYIIMAVLIAFLISYNKIQEYASWSWSPRYGLYSTAFKIFGDCFPIGTGFGTFANSISGEYYAKTYYVYDLANKVGVNPQDYVDLGDAGLAYFAEFGILGILICLIIYIKLFSIAKKKCQKDPWRLKAVYLLVGYLLIASIVENVFCNESGATSMIVLFIYVYAKNSRVSQQMQLTNQLNKGYVNVKSYETHC